MHETQRIIHTAEFAVHLALHVASPFWRSIFDREIPPAEICALQQQIMKGEGSLSPNDVEAFTLRHLGNTAVIWMWGDFISTVVPRADLQQNVLLLAVRPTVAPDADPVTTEKMCNVLDDEDRVKQFNGLEALMSKLSSQPDDPKDVDFIRAANNLIDPLNPTQRLLDSLYLTLLEPLVREIQKAT